MIPNEIIEKLDLVRTAHYIGAGFIANCPIFAYKKWFVYDCYDEGDDVGFPANDDIYTFYRSVINDGLKINVKTKVTKEFILYASVDLYKILEDTLAKQIESAKLQ